MENKIEKTGYSFKETGHLHYFDGKRMTGITSVLQIIAKPALIQWAVNMAVDCIKENLPKEVENEMMLQFQRPDFMDLLEQARKAHTKKKEAAGDVGKTVHAAIKEFIKNKTEPKLDEQGMKMFENFRKWLTDNKVEILESEKHLYSEKLFLAGICDAVVMIDGKKWLVDFKTGGTRVYAEAFFQMGGYDILLNEMGEHKDIEGYIVLGIFKDGTTEEKRSISNNDNRDAFLAALKIYRIQEKINGQIL